MARFDVYAQGTSKTLLLDVQAGLLEELSTRVVVPLMPKAAAPKAADALNPIFKIKGSNYVMVTQFMAAVPRKEIQDRVANLDSESSAILAAIDFLHHGW